MRKVFEKSQSIIILVIYLDNYQYFLHLKKTVTGRHFVTFLFFFEAFQMLETQETLGSRKLRSSAAFTPIALALRHIHKHLHFLNG